MSNHILFVWNILEQKKNILKGWSNKDSHSQGLKSSNKRGTFDSLLKLNHKKLTAHSEQKYGELCENARCDGMPKPVDDIWKYPKLGYVLNGGTKDQTLIGKIELWH